MLSLHTQCERPDLDKQKNDLVVRVAAGKRTQADLEDQILYLLSTATGSLLDNVDLINTLDQSKTTWEEVNLMLQVCVFVRVGGYCCCGDCHVVGSGGSA